MKTIAFYLRKLADLFDPSVKPSPEPITLEFRCDTTQAIQAIEGVTKYIRDLEGELLRNIVQQLVKVVPKEG
jgi:hypothetical protein